MSYFFRRCFPIWLISLHMEQENGLFLDDWLISQRRPASGLFPQRFGLFPHGCEENVLFCNGGQPDAFGLFFFRAAYI